MVIFISGGSGSGKSALAERVCTALGGRCVYIATMPVYIDEDRKKVARHHALRAGRGFETLEMPGKLTPVPDGATVLLVEQNAKKALTIADRAYVLETGSIVKEGKASDLLNDESIKKAYLGE